MMNMMDTEIENMVHPRGPHEHKVPNVSKSTFWKHCGPGTQPKQSIKVSKSTVLEDSLFLERSQIQGKLGNHPFVGLFLERRKKIQNVRNPPFGEL